MYGVLREMFKTEIDSVNFIAVGILSDYAVDVISCIASKED